MKCIDRYRIGIKGFNATAINMFEVFDIVKNVVTENKKARIEIRYDPSEEKNVRLVAVTFDDDDTEEELNRYFEF